MTNDYQIDVLGLGAVTVDFVGTVDSWPVEGAKQVLNDLTIHEGGLVGTALVAVSRLGGRACFAGKLGHSEMAEKTLAALKNNGVDTSFVLRVDHAEPIIAFVFTNTTSGHRNIFWTRSAVQYPFPPEFPDPKWYTKTKVLLIDHESREAGIAAAKLAAKHSIRVVCDIEQNESHVSELLQVSSDIVVPEDFAADYTGKTDTSDMLKTLRTSSHQTVIITRGEQGCVGLTSDGEFQLPAFKVDVVDTTGCGDVFHGAYALALALAREKTAPEAARFAGAAAALCATKLGGRNGIPTAQELQSFLKNVNLTG